MTRNPRHRSGRRGTPPGTHIPVLLREVVRCLDPQPGQTVADCTVGYGGHARAFLERIGPEGRLLGLDCDDTYLHQTRQRLADFDPAVTIVRANFAELERVMAEQGLDGFDIVLADLGVSSMQVDDPGRGIGYKEDGQLDMRMDDRLEKTAADLLAEMSPEDLSAAIRDLGDEEDHERIVFFLAAQRQVQPLTLVSQLVRLVLAAKGLTEHTWRKSPKSDFGEFHPAAKTFQAVRVLVNRELDNLSRLLEALPRCLTSGGRAGIISFQGGEDKLVREAFEAGQAAGVYAAVSDGAIRPGPREVHRNWRSASGRFRWARRA